jgi:preprotein translocase subunit SecE
LTMEKWQDSMINKAKPKKNGAVIKEETANFSPAQIKTFLNEVKVEFTKIVWPDRKITLGLTGIVIVLTIIVSAYLGFVDMSLGKLVSSFLR